MTFRTRRLARAAALLTGAAVTASTLIALPAKAEEEEKILNVYNWSDFIGDDTVKNFEKETGIKVRYDVYDSDEILHAKLVAGKTGYDVVVPSTIFAKLQLDGGLLHKLDKSRIPNLNNLDPKIQSVLGKLDPGNQYWVGWLWGYTTVGINVDKVRTALRDLPMPDNAWDLVFNPDYLSRLKSCGVSFLDSPADIVPAALHYLGRPAFSRNTADYQGVLEQLRKVRPYVTLFSSSGYINDMAGGSICVAIGWSGDFNLARHRAEEQHTGQHVATLLPKTGGLLFFDVMEIPSDAPHPGNAQLFMNYILRPEVHAAVTNKVFYANPNLASRKFLAPDVAGDPTVFPTEAELRNMPSPIALPNETRKLMSRIYSSFKSGL